MKKNKKVLVILISIFLFIFVIGFTWGVISTRSDHKKEIENVISTHGGSVLSVETIDGSKSPFVGEVAAYNTIYKIIYEKSDRKLIAWYRAVNVVNDIHSKNPSPYGQGGYSEKWIFQDE